MPHEMTTSYLKDARDLLRYYKHLSERAMEQCPDEDLGAILDGESNSIAILVKHMAGNMRSRWKDFLTTDGEKPDRNRDTEFETPPQTRAELLALWEQGWKYLFDAIEPLTEADLARVVMIRAQPHSVMQAINRQLAHYAHHSGQILLLAKHFAVKKTGKWKSLSVPRGQSNEFTAKVVSKEITEKWTGERR
ncbi:MAG TPA: DUF1572 family protein [Candidatus Acidoferrum sp.]|nr:DUF1572 family protein [Candidatus Acidoferrum sp.]